MKLNIKDYIKQSSFLENDFCDETIKRIQEIESSEWRKHAYYNNQTGKLVSNGNQELDIIYANHLDNTRIIIEKMWYSIANYIDSFKYPWFTDWSGFSPIRYNRYSLNQKMNYHCDHIHSLFDGDRKGIPILSCLGLLNDDYEGGEFFILDDLKIELKKGDLLIFPSNFMYPHRVKPVLKGVRYSYISWVW